MTDRLTCGIAAIEWLNENTRQVFLQIPGECNIAFHAGQYLEVILPADGKRCPFSIANAPSLNGMIELHIRPTPDSDDSVVIESLLDKREPLVIEIPKGDCYIDIAPDNPLILVAASTGITQMKSIIEHLLPDGLRHPVWLYWGVLAPADLYLSPLCAEWEAADSNFHYVPVVSNPGRNDTWQGRTGLVGNAVLEDFRDLHDITVVVSGSPAMVYATLDAFVDQGMPESNMKSDVFSYAPRS